MFVTPVGATYYALVGRGLTGHVGALLPALPEVERGLIIESTEWSERSQANARLKATSR